MLGCDVNDCQHTPHVVCYRKGEHRAKHVLTSHRLYCSRRCSVARVVGAASYSGRRGGRAGGRPLHLPTCQPWHTSANAPAHTAACGPTGTSVTRDLQCGAQAGMAHLRSQRCKAAAVLISYNRVQLRSVPRLLQHTCRRANVMLQEQACGGTPHECPWWGSTSSRGALLQRYRQPNAQHVPAPKLGMPQ
jgi:hypothetical protein